MFVLKFENVFLTKLFKIVMKIPTLNYKMKI